MFDLLVGLIWIALFGGWLLLVVLSFAIVARLFVCCRLGYWAVLWSI